MGAHQKLGTKCATNRPGSNHVSTSVCMAFTEQKLQINLHQYRKQQVEMTCVTHANAVLRMKQVQTDLAIHVQATQTLESMQQTCLCMTAMAPTLIELYHVLWNHKEQMLVKQ